MSAPKAQTMTASGCAAVMRATASGALTSSGWSSAMPSSSASVATGGGELASPARGSVGAGDDELRAVRRAREESQDGGRVLAGAEVDRAGHGRLRRGFVALAQDAHRLAPLVAGRAVDDEGTLVEVVHLVLDDPRLEPDASMTIGSPSGSWGCDAHVGSAARRRRRRRAGSDSPPRTPSRPLEDHCSSGLMSAWTGPSPSTR